MTFINPIEILGLDIYDVSAIDNSLIKKAKRKLFVDIDLSEGGIYVYKGKKVLKSDCERVIDELSNDDRKEYYYQLATTIQLLNNYLVSSDEKFFFLFRQESIYKLPDFVNFINPYFAYNFDRSLLKSFNNNDPSSLSSILRTQILINSDNVNKAYKSVSVEIQNRIEQIDKTTWEIRNKKSNYTNISVEETLVIVKKNFPVIIINLLPPYFQSQINKIASSINYLQLAIYDSFDNTKVSLDLLSHLLLFNIESVNKPTFENNFKIVKRRNDEKVEQEKNSPILKDWADKLSRIKKMLSDTKAGLITAVEIDGKIRTLFLAYDLNNLPSYGNEIREQIALGLQNLAIAVWNDLDDIEIANNIIDKALNIGTNERIKKDLLETKQDLGRIRFEIDQRKKKELSVNSNSAHSDNNYGCLIFILIAVVFFIIYAVSNSNRSSKNNDYSYSSPSYNNEVSQPYTSPSGNNRYVDSTVSAVSDSAISIIDSALSVTNEYQYENVRMTNGNITGCDDFKPEYNKAISNRLEVSVGFMSSVAIKLVNYLTNDCIRYIYIQKGTSYTIRNIPEGRYYLKITYGNDWGVKKGESKCDGKFLSNPLFKKGDEILDFTLVETGNGYEVPSYSLSLDVSYTTEGDGFSTNHISENEFYEK